MKKIKEFLKKIAKWIGTDGLLHILCCYAIGISVGIYTNFGLGAFITIFVGLLKEIVWDAKLKKGTFEWKDIVCDVIGAVLAALVLLPKIFIN